MQFHLGIRLDYSSDPFVTWTCTTRAKNPLTLKR